MHEGLEALTEKEKEALRLIVRGHDAKSSANELGLSVHTVNERLRSARRKLAVTSSREAARLLLDAEGSDDEFLAYRSLGDAGSGEAAQTSGQPAQGDGDWRRAGWMIGGLVMTISIALLALASLSAPGQPPAVPQTLASAAAPISASEQEAIKAAQDFLILFDSDDWAASWEATHQSFKLLNTADWWAEASRKVRGDMGTATSRELATIDFAPAPPDGHWVISFKASYSRKGSVTETLSLASENGGWKVVGITVE